MATAAAPGGSESPRWLADAMLGKLARYLRFLGHDTESAGHRTDAELRDSARAEGRTVLTRDRRLAARAEPSLLLRSLAPAEQLREVHTRYPAVSFEVKFDRCPECNVLLRPWTPPNDATAWPGEIPVALVRGGLRVTECGECHRHFWEGSHSRRIRAIVLEAIEGPGAA